MKRANAGRHLATFAALALLACAPACAAPDDDEEEAKPPTPMQALDRLKGVWVGEMAATNAAGEPIRVRHSARVGNLLDGDLLLIETRGMQRGGRIGEHSFAVISHDLGTGRYEIRTYAHGRAGTYPLQVGVNQLRWEVPLGRGATLRQYIAIDGDTWLELHEFVTADKPPHRTLELRMQRRSASDWPEAGAP